MRIECHEPVGCSYVGCNYHQMHDIIATIEVLTYQQRPRVPESCFLIFPGQSWTVLITNDVSTWCNRTQTPSKMGAEEIERNLSYCVAGVVQGGIYTGNFHLLRLGACQADHGVCDHSCQVVFCTIPVILPVIPRIQGQVHLVTASNCLSWTTSRAHCCG